MQKARSTLFMSFISLCRSLLTFQTLPTIMVRPLIVVIDLFVVIYGCDLVLGGHVEIGSSSTGVPTLYPP
jgi:hypothetical protein